MLLWLLSALAWQPVESAPGWSAYAWTPAEGMPSDQATRLVHGEDGSVWVATYDGLVRLLGDQVSVFGPAQGLSDARIVDLTRDARGTIWIVTEHGLLARWTGERVEPVDVGDATGKIYTTAHAGSETWLLGGDHPIRLDGGEPAPTPVQGLPPLGHDVHLLPGGGRLMLAAESAFHVADGEARLIHQGVLAAHVDTTGTAWFGYRNGLWRWRPGGAPIPVELRHAGHVCAFLETPAGLAVGTWDDTWRLWDGAAFGPTRPGDLCRGPLLDPAGRLWYRIGDWFTRDGTPVTRTGPVEHSLWLASDDVLLATETLGVVRVRQAWAQNVGPDTPLSHTPVYPVVSNGETVWTASKSFEVFQVRGEAVRSTHADFGPRSNTSQVLLTSLRPRPDGQLLVASMLGVCTLSPTLESCAIEYAEETDHAFFDPLGRTWLSTAPGLVLQTPGQPDRAWALSVQKLGGYRHPRPLAWHDGTLWFGDLLGGLYRLRPDGAEQARVGTGKLRHIGPAADGSLWVAPEGRGICRVRPTTPADLSDLPPPGALRMGPLAADIRCADTSNGLHENLVHAVVDDGAGRTWYSTNHGIGWIHTDALHAVLDGRAERLYPVVLGRTDGMLDEEGNGGDPPSVARTDDGRLWFATMRGLVVLDPATIPDLPAPEVRWLSFEAGSNALSPRPLTAATGLAADERRIRVRWAAATFDHPDQITWRYRLEGHDQGWIEARGITALEHANLPPGALRLVVQAGRAGRWGPAAVLPIERRPVLTETLAFPILIALGSGTVIGLLLWGRLRVARAHQRRLQDEVNAQTLELRVRNDQLQEQALLLAERAGEISAQAERLRQQDQARTRFVANLSHELRTPLTLVTGPARALTDVAGLPPEARTAAEVIHRNASRLDELVDQLLDVARLEVGSLPLRARCVDLGQLVSRVADRFSPAAQARGVSLTVEDQRAPMFLDPDKIDKVLSNLLSNALKFTPTGGQIAVRVRAPQGEGEGAAARVEVEDSGIGIDPAAQARLFERFFQVDDGDTRRFQGAGIGLNLAMELVHLHGGEIGVESRPGVGSRFWFTLPGGSAHLAIEEIDLDPAQNVALPLSVSPAGTTGAASVLVVEDNPDMRAWILTHLAPRFNASSAPDGLAALQAIHEAPPDLIVSDVMMPGMDGLTLCRRLRADPQTADIPVLLLSAKVEEYDRLAALEVANDYLTKPFFPAELVVRMQRLLAGSTRSSPAEAADPEHEQALRARLEHQVSSRLNDPELSITTLAKAMASSRRQLHRDVTRLTGLSPTDYLQQVRLDHARDLLERGAYATVAEIAAEVGLSPNYLARLYRARWGCSPSDHLARRARPTEAGPGPASAATHAGDGSKKA
jgi:signal transduction histidine kinase/CheY-like chemotaxis protein